MTWHTGRLLVATPALDDPNFRRAVILVLDHDEEGALGVVLNRRTDVELPEALASWEPLLAGPAVLFGGGPVEPDAIVALGASTSVVTPEGVAPLFGRIRLVDLDTDPAVAAADLERLRIFAGYAGWGPEQLEDELEQGAWLAVDAEPDDVFSPTPQQLWGQVLKRQPGELKLLSTYPADPSLN